MVVASEHDNIVAAFHKRLKAERLFPGRIMYLHWLGDNKYYRAGTMAIYFESQTNNIYIGIALCSMLDNFDRKKGRKVATNRLHRFDCRLQVNNEVLNVDFNNFYSGLVEFIDQSIYEPFNTESFEKRKVVSQCLGKRFKQFPDAERLKYLIDTWAEKHKDDQPIQLGIDWGKYPPKAGIAYTRDKDGKIYVQSISLSSTSRK